ALLLENFVQRASAAQVFIDAGILPAEAPFVPFFFLSMFANFAAKSLILPIHGAGALLYAPVAFYPLAYLFGFHARRARSERGLNRYDAATLGLAIMAVWPLILMAVFYSQIFHELFTGVSNAATGRIRHLWNIWPFALTLATFVLLGRPVRWSSRTTRKLVLRIGVICALVEYLIFFVLQWVIENSLYLISHTNRTGIEPSTLVSLADLADPWLFLPLVNLGVVGAIALALGSGDGREPSRAVLSAAASFAAVLLFVTVMNDLRQYQG